MKNYIILTLASILIIVVILLFVLIKDNNSTTLKCRSYETAMNVLSNPGDKEVFKKISAIDDVDALRIIVFSTYSAAWPMEAGSNENFDCLLFDIHLCALKKLISINTDESKYSVDFYKRAFPLDGCLSHSIEDIE
jgi:hypothetical protein